MRNIILIHMFLASINVSFGQMYIGKQADKLKSYNCSIRINRDSSINVIYDRDFNAVYGEHSGTIKKLNDTLYRISAIMVIGQFYIKSFNKDTIYIQLDSNIAKQLDKIQIEYSDSRTRKQLQGYDKLGKPIRLLRIAVDQKLFNAKNGTDFVTITINRKSSLTDNYLSFRIPFGSAASFTSGQNLELDVIIKGNKLWTVGQPPLQTGHFKLDKKSGT